MEEHSKKELILKALQTQEGKIALAQGLRNLLPLEKQARLNYISSVLYEEADKNIKYLDQLSS